MGKKKKRWQILFSWAPKSLKMVISLLAPPKKRYDKPGQCIKKQRYHFINKGPFSKSYGFSGSHVEMWELDHKESWALKNWCFRIAVLEKTLESPLDCKGIKPVNPKRKSTLNIHWKNWCWSSNSLATWCEELTHLKRSWCWERLKSVGDRTTEDKMVGWYHQLNTPEFE